MRDQKTRSESAQRLSILLPIVGIVLLYIFGYLVV